MKKEYDHYFPDLGNAELADRKMARNPFYIDMDILSNNLQKEFLEMKCNSTAKDDFEAMSLNDFWAKYLPVYKNVGSAAIRTLLPLSSTYLCESGFSTLVSVKTKFRNKLECEADLQCVADLAGTVFSLLLFYQATMGPRTLVSPGEQHG